ncbi:hypothetical protein DPMN_017037 [Dreissena polymorpha]|uniref:Uncharacterized protein n=1 Tax=Dreissena polymorpha TaxID=45954 RepID=A0A9D4NGR4_DREPO|nr:hypothetical protein DPMN_017037 [Dreissena polymorpha]
MVDLTSEVLGIFIKAETIPDSVTALTKLDVRGTTLQKTDKDPSVGPFEYTESKAKMDKSCTH